MNNSLSGSIPPQLSKLSLLLHFQFDNHNLLEGEIPASYGNITGLVKLSLRNCSLQGSLPDFSKISNLSYLDISLNHLTGPIPPKQLSPSITTISIGNNLLTGSVHASIWKNMAFDSKSELLLDFQNNLLSNVSGDLNYPQNVTLWRHNTELAPDTCHPTLAAGTNAIFGHQFQPKLAFSNFFHLS